MMHPEGEKPLRIVLRFQLMAKKRFRKAARIVWIIVILMIAISTILSFTPINPGPPPLP